MEILKINKLLRAKNPNSGTLTDGDALTGVRNMAKLSPLQTVKKIHGSKEELAKKVLGFLECPENEEKEHFEKRISVMSNTKLLRLYNAHQTLVADWGTREALVEKITKAQFPGGNKDYANKISTFSTARLLDLGRRFKVKK